MLPSRKPSRRQTAFAAKIRKNILRGNLVKRADLLKAIDIENAAKRWKEKQQNAKAPIGRHAP